MIEFHGSSARDTSAAAPEPLRGGFKPLLVLAFAGLILVALSSAFLLGLAAVGLLALVVGGFELLRRHLMPAKAPASYLITGR